MQLSPMQSRLAASIIASCLLLAIYLFLFTPHFALAAEIGGASLGHSAERDAEFLALLDDEDSATPIGSRSPEYEPDFGLFDRSIIGRATEETQTLVNNEVREKNLDENSQATFVFQFSSISSREAGESGRTAELRKRSNGSQDQDVEVEEPNTDDADADADADKDGEGHELRRRQSATKTLWITANTCLQPDRPVPDTTGEDPPQLTLYVSTSKDNQSPGPMAKGNQDTLLFEEGAVMYNTTVSGDVYFTVAAPFIKDTFTSKMYNFEVAVSVDQPYHYFDNTTDPNVNWVDSDAGAALLITGNLTDNPDTVMTEMPYSLFAYAQGDVSVLGVRNSYCGLGNYAQIGGNRSTLPKNMMSMGMTRRGEGNLTKQEFFFTGLNKSTTYQAILTTNPGFSSNISTSKRDTGVGSKKVVFRQTEFDTKSTGACMVISNLTFCDQVAYSVPGNETRFGSGKVEELKSFYDDYAQTMYKNFEKAMTTIPCDIENTSKYSLARNCDDCKQAYKNWICFVSIPRCEDYSKTDLFLQPRNINSTFPDGTTVDNMTLAEFGNQKAYNSSRRPDIDTVVAPGPYKEVLPCEELCYDIVQSCPASLSFSCPLPGSDVRVPGKDVFSSSYGQHRDGDKSVVTCNYPDAAHYRRSASAIVSLPWTMMGLLGGGALLLLL
ncbi:hypothetical protein JX266_001493 [Neoarthrinium moseri]|nr:hypothetical protein JX266_001493 [Neoarthrinium moseri]